MSKFKIIPHDTKEYHCRQALKAFDPLCIITLDKEDLIVETNKLDHQTIQCFTSVKEVTNLDNQSQWTLTHDFAIKPSWTPPNIQGSNIFNSNTILNTNPNGTCLLLNEVKNKIQNLLASTTGTITNNSLIKLHNNITGICYVVPSTSQNSKVEDIINPINNKYDYNKCVVYEYSASIIPNIVPWICFDGATVIGPARKNVIDVHESTRGILTISYI